MPEWSRNFANPETVMVIHKNFTVAYATHLNEGGKIRRNRTARSAGHAKNQIKNKKV